MLEQVGRVEPPAQGAGEVSRGGVPPLEGIQPFKLAGYHIWQQCRLRLFFLHVKPVKGVVLSYSKDDKSEIIMFKFKTLDQPTKGLIKGYVC